MHFVKKKKAKINILLLLHSVQNIWFSPGWEFLGILKIICWTKGFTTPVKSIISWY